MRVTRSTARRGTVGAVVLATLVVSLVVPSSASSAEGGGWLCRVRTGDQAPVFRASDGRWIYTIPEGRDMRVHTFRDGAPGALQLYGHGGGHQQNGWADSRNFSVCR